MTLDPQNASDPTTANHHWYPFLRYVHQCSEAGKEVSVNDWLITQGRVKDYKAEAEARKEAQAKAELEAKAKAASEKS